MNKDKIYLSLGVLICVGLLILMIGSGTGRTHLTGYVVKTEQTSFPFKKTEVTFTIEHPSSVVDTTYYTQNYAGHHSFTLGYRYGVTAEKGWFELYPRIVDKGIIQ